MPYPSRVHPVALSPGCRRAFGGRIGDPQALPNGRYRRSCSRRAPQVKRGGVRHALANVGNRMASERQAGVRLPVFGTRGGPRSLTRGAQCSRSSGTLSGKPPRDLWLLHRSN